MNTFTILEDRVISTSQSNTHTFLLVDKIPNNYIVWNIGANMGHVEYLPLAERMSNDKHSDDYYSINTNTLKAIKLPANDVTKLQNASSWGISSLADAQKAIKSKRTGYTADKKREHARNTIDIFTRITA